VVNKGPWFFVLGVKIHLFAKNKVCVVLLVGCSAFPCGLHQG